MSRNFLRYLGCSLIIAGALVLSYETGYSDATYAHRQVQSMQYEVQSAVRPARVYHPLGLPGIQFGHLTPSELNERLEQSRSAKLEDRIQFIDWAEQEFAGN